jgi:hypothetical protein
MATVHDRGFYEKAAKAFEHAMLDCWESGDLYGHLEECQRITRGFEPDADSDVAEARLVTVRKAGPGQEAHDRAHGLPFAYAYLAGWFRGLSANL